MFNKKEYLKEYQKRNRDKLNLRKKIWTRKMRENKKQDKEPEVAQISLFEKGDNRHCAWCGLLKVSKYCCCGTEEFMIEHEDSHLKNNCVICGKDLTVKSHDKKHLPTKKTRKEMLKHFLVHGNWCIKCSHKKW